MLAIITYETFGGVPGEADGADDILVFMDPFRYLFDALWSRRALPGPSSDSEFLENENGEDVGGTRGRLTDLVVFEGK